MSITTVAVANYMLVLSSLGKTKQYSNVLLVSTFFIENTNCHVFKHKRFCQHQIFIKIYFVCMNSNNWNKMFLSPVRLGYLFDFKTFSLSNFYFHSTINLIFLEVSFNFFYLIYGLLIRENFFYTFAYKLSNRILKQKVCEQWDSINDATHMLILQIHST